MPRDLNLSREEVSDAAPVTEQSKSSSDNRHSETLLRFHGSNLVLQCQS